MRESRSQPRPERKIEMKKTDMHVVIVRPYQDDEGNRDANVWKRTVHEDESGKQFARIDSCWGCWVALDSLEQEPRTTLVYY